jgi:hypothetical protein
LTANINLSIDDLRNVRAELARRNFLRFILHTKKDFVTNWHHKYIAERLQLFAEGKIKHMIILLPTQVGKSEMSSRRLPAYLLGRNPDLKIGIASYSHIRAGGFCSDVQQIMSSPEYEEIFPNVKLPGTGETKQERTNKKRKENEFDIIGHRGGVYAAGRGGSWSGVTIDVSIFDDMVKDMAEAVSIAYQTKNNHWFDSTAKTRLDDRGQLLFVNTRWNEDDLVGYVMKAKEYDFEVIVFPALKVDNSNPHDPREIGEALWPWKHSRERYEKQRKANPVVFETNQQQNPGVPLDILVYPEMWEQIEEMPGYSKFYGLDFGHAVSPMCLTECQQKGEDAYARELFYVTGREMSEKLGKESTRALAEYIRNVGAENGPIYCDSAHPDRIEDLQILGINAVPAIKGPGSIIAGIQHMHGLNMHVTADSTNGWLEKKKYQYPAGPDNKALPGADPIDSYNHFMDSTRYAFYSHMKLYGKTAYESEVELY